MGYNHLTVLKQITYAAYWAATKAHKSIFSEDPKKELVSVLHLNTAIAKMGAAEALYHARIEELERIDIEKVFAKFDTFAREMTNNIATQHSHQWTDIEFRAFKEEFESSILNLKDSPT